MKINIQKLDDRIKKFQEARRIADDPELMAILLEFMTTEETVGEPILTPKPPENATPARAANTREMVNDLLNGTGADVNDRLWSRRK